MTTTLEQTEIRDQSSEISQSAAPAMESAGLLRMIDTLTEKQQEVLRLKFQGGLSYVEIANVMEITVNHVGVMIHTAIKTLRERMEGMAQKSEIRSQKPPAGKLAADGEVLS
jgi:RNA polymerase sigma-70 factor (ECF subfamily)